MPPCMAKQQEASKGDGVISMQLTRTVLVTQCKNYSQQYKVHVFVLPPYTRPSLYTHSPSLLLLPGGVQLLPLLQAVPLRLLLRQPPQHLRQLLIAQAHGLPPCQPCPCPFHSSCIRCRSSSFTADPCLNPCAAPCTARRAACLASVGRSVCLGVPVQAAGQPQQFRAAHGGRQGLQQQRLLVRQEAPAGGKERGGKQD